MIKKIFSFLKEGLKEDLNGKPSSKRIALAVVLFLFSFVVLFYTNKTNSIEMSLILSTLITALTGVAVYNNIKKN